MAWMYIAIAGALEVAWALGLKTSDGLSRPWISGLTVVGMVLSFVFLAQGMRHLPVGTAYPVWTGIGAIGSVVCGIVFLGESREPLRLVFLALIVVGILGLRFGIREGA